MILLLSVTAHDIIALLHVGLINVVNLTGMCLYEFIMTLHFLNDGVNYIESIRKIDSYVIIVSLNSKSAGKLINRLPGLRLLISSSQSSALRTHIELLGKPRDVNKRSLNLAW